MRKARGRLVPELAAMAPPGGVLCNRQIVDSHAWSAKKVSKFELQELWSNVLKDRKVLVVIGSSFQVDALEPILHLAAGAAVYFVRDAELEDISGLLETLRSHSADFNTVLLAIESRSSALLSAGLDCTVQTLDVGALRISPAPRQQPVPSPLTTANAGSQAAWASFPRPHLQRSTAWQSLNGKWSVHISTRDQEMPPENFEDGFVEVPFPAESHRGGLQRRISEYERRRFYAVALQSKGVCFLFFVEEDVVINSTLFFFAFFTSKARTWKPEVLTLAKWVLVSVTSKQVRGVTPALKRIWVRAALKLMLFKFISFVRVDHAITLPTTDTADAAVPSNLFAYPLFVCKGATGSVPCSQTESCSAFTEVGVCKDLMMRVNSVARLQRASLGSLNTPRRPDLPAFMLVHSLVSLPPPQKPEEVRDDVDLEPWFESSFEAGKLNLPGSPCHLSMACPTSTPVDLQALGTNSSETLPEPSHFCASFDSGGIFAELPEHVRRAPDRRTHELYVQYLDQYLQDMQLDKRGFRLAVLRRRRRDFPTDSLQTRFASLFPSMSRHDVLASAECHSLGQAPQVVPSALGCKRQMLRSMFAAFHSISGEEDWALLRFLPCSRPVSLQVELWWFGGLSRVTAESGETEFGIFADLNQSMSGGYDPFTFELAVHGGKDRRLWALIPAMRDTVQLTIRVWDPTDSGCEYAVDDDQPPRCDRCCQTGWQPRGKQSLQPGFIMYSAASGPWQSIWLEEAPRGCLIASAAAELLDTKRIRFQVDLTESSPCAGMFLRVAVFLEGAMIAEGGGSTEAAEVVGPEAWELWSPTKPTLHMAKLSLCSSTRSTCGDSVDFKFALRMISRTAEPLQGPKGEVALLLNGEALLQSGVLYQAYWPESLITPPSEEAMLQDLRSIKNSGFNMVRVHAAVLPAMFYHFCDLEGLLVWQ
ncbi:unnamed protein product, partial [Symbiodinium sp. CCMP2456]